MLIPDVNVWLPAIRSDLPESTRMTQWVGEALDGREPVGLSELVASAVMRIASSSRVFVNPSPPVAVLAVLEQFREHPNVVSLRPGARHWAAFRGLCEVSGVIGPAIADAYHAALALERDAIFVTRDHGFAAFPGLRLRLLEP